MKRTSLLIIQLTLIFSCYAQQRLTKNGHQSNSTFANEFLNNFTLGQLPYNTKNIDIVFGSLEKKYKKISETEIRKYISKDIYDIGYDYVSHNSDNWNDSISGFAKFEYNYICQFSLNNFHPVLYLKGDPVDSLSVYFANYSSAGKCLDKLIIHCYKDEFEIRKAKINADFTIKICKYEPIDNIEKTKITIYHFRLNSLTGMFNKISEETKIGKKYFNEYLFSKVDLSDDPINQ